MPTKDPLRIAFFGSSLVSAYWNGAATYYRGIIRALNKRGHKITFYEPDAFERQQHRDLADPDWAKVCVYAPTEDAAAQCLQEAKHADLIIKASGVGVLDEFLEAGVASMKSWGKMTAFWDVDAPATLDRLDQNPSDPFAALVPKYDIIFTYGGGEPVVRSYKTHGAHECVPIYNALDPKEHHPVPRDDRFIGELGFLGNRLPDREARVEEFFLKAASYLPDEVCLLGGNGWDDKPLPPSVKYLGHVYTQEHNAFNCSVRAVLNISRESMARYGYSPATRVFEAAGAGACLITDRWEGIELFLEPNKEVLVAENGQQVADLVRGLTSAHAHAIGRAALHRVLCEHTYEHRAAQFDEVLSGKFARAGAH